MAATKRFVVLGLGTFGTALAQRLHENHCHVTGVDDSEEQVELLRDYLYEGIIGDATDRELLEHLSLDTADAVFISLGDDIARSLLAALHCKELGARRIVVKGVTVEHGKLLEHLGVERIVFPEIEVARELADRMTWPNFLDYIPIDPEHSVVELAVPESLNGRTLAEAKLRQRYGVHVLGIKDVLTGKLDVLPSAEARLTSDQVLLVVGKQDGLNRLRELS